MAYGNRPYISKQIKINKMKRKKQQNIPCLNAILLVIYFIISSLLAVYMEGAVEKAYSTKPIYRPD
jgi:hypothetical protein